MPSNRCTDSERYGDNCGPVPCDTWEVQLCWRKVHQRNSAYTLSHDRFCSKETNRVLALDPPPVWY